MADDLYFRKRNRLEGYDYSESGFYFVTTCVENRENVFGSITDSRCELSDYGKIFEKILHETIALFPGIDLDYYVIMPDHVHLIIIINSTEEKKKAKSLSGIIGAVKSRSSAAIHQAGFKSFKWQPSFYDRIIRNERELFYIRQYIEQNPLRSEIDDEFADNMPKL